MKSAFVAWALLLAACDGGGGSKSGGIELTDANNWGYTSALTCSSINVQSGVDFTIDWSTLTTDFLGHAMDPTTDIDQVWLMWFRNLTQDELCAGLADGTVSQRDLDWPATYNTVGAETSVETSTLSFSGNAFDATKYLATESGTYMARVCTGLDQDCDTRMLGFVAPVSTSTDHALDLTNDSAILDFAADLHTLTPLTTTVDAGTYVDWAEVTMDGQGAEIQWDDVSELWLARFDGLTVTDLEAQFLDLESIDSALYTAQIYGKEGQELTEALAADGTAFPGFQSGELWILALRCPDCTSPAPPYLSVLNVE